MRAAGGAFWGVFAVVAGTYASIPLIAAGGAALAIGCVAYAIGKTKQISDAEKSYLTLKEYAQTHDLEKAQRHAQAKVNRPKNISTFKASKFGLKGRRTR